MRARTYRRRLYERALDRYGYVTTHDARELGVPTVELRKLAARGGLERVGHGVYRFLDVPRTSLDEYMENVLIVGGQAHLTGESVLALHDLAFVNPPCIRVGTASRVRPTLPATVEVVRQSVPTEDLTEYEGIPAVTIARALRDCSGSIPFDRLLAAIDEAERRGLLTGLEAQDVRAFVQARA